MSIDSDPTRTMNSTLRPAASIRHADVDGLRVILDLNTESYFVLDDVASAMWHAVTETPDLEAATRRIGSCFEVEATRLRRDFDRFVSTCLERKFLETPFGAVMARGPAPGARSEDGLGWFLRSPLGGWLPVRALYALVVTARELKRDGFGTVYERCRHVRTASLPRDASQLQGAFALAENLYVARRAPDDCLPRSLVEDFNGLPPAGLRRPFSSPR